MEKEVSNQIMEVFKESITEDIRLLKKSKESALSISKGGSLVGNAMAIGSAQTLNQVINYFKAKYEIE